MVERARGASMWLLVWLPPYCGSAALVLRLVYEQTVLSWQFGPQPVGFALAHSELGFVFLVAVAAMALWCVAAAGYFSWVRVTRPALATRPIGRLLVVAMCTLGSIAVPRAFWRFTTISVAGPGPHAADWLSDAAGAGDLTAVRAILARGVSVDANSGGSTALEAAAIEGRIRVAEFLLAHGADPNARSRYGSTPLAHAAERGHRDVGELLVRHGALFLCTGSQRAHTNAYLAAHGETWGPAAGDSSWRRLSATMDSTLASWALRFGKPQANCVP